MAGLAAGDAPASPPASSGASSGATERANADTATLFAYLWNNFSNTICPVSTGRGANAAADFAANKTITLLDWRGYVPGGLDDMGNTAASRWANVPVVSGDAVTAGSVLGEATHVVSQAELPNVNFVVNIPSGQGSHKHTYSKATGSYGAAGGGAGLAVTIADTDTSTSTLPQMTGTAASGGSGTAHNTVQKTVLGTFFIKL